MRSPGHAEHPEHKVVERRLGRRMTVDVAGERVADSRDVIEVAEDGNPPRYYFPRGDVRMEKLSRSSTTSVCPFKGTAHYFGVQLDRKRIDDAAWSYEEPYDEHGALKDRIAFWDGKIADIAIRSV